MAINYTIDLSIILTVVAIIITVYLAIWSRYGLKADTSGIKQSIDERMGDLLGIVDRLIDKIGGTVKQNLKNIGEIKISIEDIRKEEIIYKLVTEVPIFKRGLLRKKARGTVKLLNLEKELFEKKKTRIRFVLPKKINLHIPSTDEEVCNRYIAFYLKWLDSEYWKALKQFEEREKSLLIHLKEQKFE